MTAGERMFQFIDYKGFGEGRKGKSLRAFYEFIGIPVGSFKIDRSIGTDNLMKIFVKFPELNMDWIITGRGEMIIQDVSQNTQQQPLNAEEKKQIDELKQEVIALQRKVIELMTSGKEVHDKISSQTSVSTKA